MFSKLLSTSWRNVRASPQVKMFHQRARLQNGRHSNRATSLVNYYRIELRAQCHKFVYQALLCKSHVQKGWRWSDGKRSISFLLFRDSMTMEIKLHLVVALKWLVILWWAKKKDKTWWLFMKLVQPSRDMDFGVTWSKFAPSPKKKRETGFKEKKPNTPRDLKKVLPCLPDKLDF